MFVFRGIFQWLTGASAIPPTRFLSITYIKTENSTPFFKKERAGLEPGGKSSIFVSWLQKLLRQNMQGIQKRLF